MQLVDSSHKNNDFYIDSSIFSNRKLSFAQALVLYLKEEKKLSYSRIAKILNRDDRTIWSIYNNACEKIGLSKYVFEPKNILIPLRIFLDRNFSMMEAAILFLKKKGLKNKEIADALSRSDRTISSLLVRMKKRGDVK